MRAMRVGKGIRVDIISISICLHDIARRRGWKWGVTPRERRDASGVALSHRPSRVATDSLCRCERTNGKECYISACSPPSWRVECIPCRLQVLSHRFVPRDFRLSVIASPAREIAFDRLHTSGIGDQLSTLIF